MKKLNFTISKVSEPTTNKNRIVTLHHKQTTALGVVKKGYCIAVEDSDTPPVVGASIELDLDMFQVVNRPFTDDNGNTVDIKWLALN